MLQGGPSFGDEVSPRISGNGDGIEIFRFYSTRGETISNRLGGEAGDMLDSNEPFLLCGRDKLPVLNQSSRGLRVVGVDPEDQNGDDLRRRSNSPSRTSTIRRSQKAWRKWKRVPRAPSRKPRRTT